MVKWLWFWVSKRGRQAVLTAHGCVDQALPLIQAAFLLAAGQGAGVVQRSHLAHLQWQDRILSIQAGTVRSCWQPWALDPPPTAVPTTAPAASAAQAPLPCLLCRLLAPPTHPLTG